MLHLDIFISRAYSFLQKDFAEPIITLRLIHAWVYLQGTEACKRASLLAYKFKIPYNACLRTLSQLTFAPNT